MGKRFWVIFLFLLPASALWGQEREDSLQQNRRIKEVLAEQCANPRVLARERFSRQDFFLHCPLPAGAWHASPNVFDPESGYPVYLPEGQDIVYYSAPDLSGSRSLFLSEEMADSLWRAPRHPAEALISRGNEIFPMLSPDGRTLYFASDGLPGLGGFDLFSSTWDDANAIWGEPVNMGIPYNSPADDFLLFDTEDGKFTILASNRDCGKDSVSVYVLEYEAFPLRTPIHDEEALAQLLALTPLESFSTAGRTSGNAITRLYMRKMAEVRSLRDSLYKREQDLDALRQRLALAGDSELSSLTNLIQNREGSLTPIRNRIASVNREIRQIENSFLRRGSSSGAAEGNAEEDLKAPSFQKQPMGGKLLQAVGKPDNNFYFEHSGWSSAAETAPLPEGIVYQIYLFTSARHSREDSFGGITPVYERLNSNLRYSYYAGLFPTYRLALQYLNVVRKLGFPDARIVAYSDGRSIPVNQARQEE